MSNASGRVLETASSIQEDAFRMFDSDGDGLINTSDLCAALNKLGQIPTPSELKSMIQEVDANGDGKIDYHEFLELASRGISDTQSGSSSEASLRHAFKVFDKDGDGFITPAELREELKASGKVLTLEEAEVLVKECDLDGDGKLCYAEFAKFIDETT
jgi:calmodulin